MNVSYEGHIPLTVWPSIWRGSHNVSPPVSIEQWGAQEPEVKNDLTKVSLYHIFLSRSISIEGKMKERNQTGLRAVGPRGASNTKATRVPQGASWLMN